MATGVFVGLSTIDVVYSVDEFPTPNSKTVANDQDVFVGGPATNASVTFAHLGGRARLVSVVGRHLLAGVIREELQQYSVQLTELNPDFEGMPVISSVSVSRAGERNVVSANATRVKASPPRVEEIVLEGVSVVMIDGHYMQAGQAWARAARSKGVKVVFDGGSWKKGTSELLRNVDIAICSADFLPPGCPTGDQIVRYLREHGVANIAITRGAGPINFASGDTAGMIEVPRIKVVSTLGAGDIFHGAFCYFNSIGNGFVEALGQAAGVAAHSCRFPGTREWMKNPRRLGSHGAVVCVGASEPSSAGVGQEETKAKGSHGLTRTAAERDVPAVEIARRSLIVSGIGVAVAAFTGAVGIVEMMPGFRREHNDTLRQQREAAAGAEELRELLTSYLYPIDPGRDRKTNVPLVPPMQDPWGPPKRVFSGSGNAVVAAYISALSPRNCKHRDQGIIDVKDDDAPVIIGSHFVSRLATEYFGDPKSIRAIHEPIHSDRFGRFSARLRWALYTPEEANTVCQRQPFQEVIDIRREPVHALSDLDNSKLPQATFIRQGDVDYQKNDYLLISVLPRDSRFDRRIVSFAGLYRPGTLAAKQLLSNHDLALEILRQIHEKVEGCQYYQALLSLSVDHRDRDSPRPIELKFRDAQAISVKRLKGLE